MAVFEMKKLLLAVHMNDLGKIINDLVWLGAVEIAPHEINPDDGDSEWSGIVSRIDIEDDREALDKIDEKLKRLASAIDFLEACGKSGGKFIDSGKSIFRKIVGFFAAKNYLYREDVNFYDPESTQSKYAEAVEMADEINRIKEQSSELTEEKSKLESMKKLCIPWIGLGVPMSAPETGSTITILGTMQNMSHTSSELEISEILNETAERLNQVVTADITLISSDRQKIYIALIYHADDRDLIENSLASCGILRMNFGDIHVTAEEKIEEIDRKIKLIETALKDIKAIGIEMSARSAVLRKFYDINIAKQLEIQIRQKFLRTEAAAISGGCIPADKASALKEIAEKYSCYLEIQDSDSVVKLRHNIFSGKFYEGNRIFEPVELKLRYNIAAFGKKPGEV